MSELLTEAELRRRLESGAGDVEDYRRLAEVLMWAMRHDEAIGVCRLALARSLEPLQQAEILGDLAVCLDAIGRTPEAVRSSEEALALLATVPGTSPTRIARAMARADLARYVWATDEPSARDMAERALADFERVFAEDPAGDGVEVAYREAAELAIWIGDAEKAIAYGRAGREQSTEMRERMLCLGALGEGLRLLGRYDDAERAVDEALAIAGEHRLATARLLLTRGLVLRGAGRTVEAGQTLEEAIATAEGLPGGLIAAYRETVHGYLADIYYGQEKYREAAASYQTVLLTCPPTSPVRPHVRLMLGHCYLATGAEELAREHYEAVLADATASDDHRHAAGEGLAALDPPAPPPPARRWPSVFRWRRR